MSLKIAFTGSGGTGKTTTARKLAEALNIPFIPSPSRAAFEKHKVATEDDQRKLTAEQRFALQMDIFHAIDASVMSTKEGVFDRTHLDNFFYACHQCPDVITSIQYDNLDTQCYRGMKTFTHIFFAPIYPRWGIEDGMRTTGYASRRVMQSFLRDWISMHGFRPDGILEDESTDWRIIKCMEIVKIQPTGSGGYVFLDPATMMSGGA